MSCVLFINMSTFSIQVVCDPFCTQKNMLHNFLCGSKRHPKSKYPDADCNGCGIQCQCLKVFHKFHLGGKLYRPKIFALGSKVTTLCTFVFGAIIMKQMKNALVSGLAIQWQKSGFVCLFKAVDVSNGVTRANHVLCNLKHCFRYIHMFVCVCMYVQI